MVDSWCHLWQRELMVSTEHLPLPASLSLAGALRLVLADEDTSCAGYFREKRHSEQMSKLHLFPRGPWKIQKPDFPHAALSNEGLHPTLWLCEPAKPLRLQDLCIGPARVGYSDKYRCVDSPENHLTTGRWELVSLEARFLQVTI